MVQSKKQASGKPKFAVLMIGDKEVGELYEASNSRLQALGSSVIYDVPQGSHNYSLFGACKVLGKSPERWLCYVLKHIS